MFDREQLKLVDGRLAMHDEEAELLAEVCRTPGDHIEIGTLWGATSIIAALNKPRPHRIFTVDIMARGFWVDGDPGAPGQHIPTARAILANFASAGVADRITTICSNSHPLPIKDINPSTALIDAGHGGPAVLHDWENISVITERFVMLHDCTDKHPEVMEVLRNVVLMDSRWTFKKQVNSLVLMERKEQ